MEFTYYLIHCKEHNEREEHIENVKSLLNKPITLIDGINTKDNSLDMENQKEYIYNFDNNLIFNGNWHFNKPGQIGCYLSHFKTIKKIMNESVSDYSVIFEDDVKFKPDLDKRIKKIIEDINSLHVDFDIIFLGCCNMNKGEKLINNIYHIDKKNYTFGAHALLINNKNIEKIYNVNCKIKHEVDNHYFFSFKKNHLNGFVINPYICSQNRSLKSNIEIV